MVSNGTGGVGRLPDEAFASHARRPDPSRDEHVAFPGEDPPEGTAGPIRSAGLPPSAWAPRRAMPPQAALPPEVTALPPEVRELLTAIAARQRVTRVRSRGRLNPVALGLAIVVALALIINSNGSGGAETSGGYGFEISSSSANGPTIHDVVNVPFEHAAVMLPTDQPVSRMSPGPGAIRVELVSDGSAASATITSAADTVKIDKAPMPLAAELALTEIPERLVVSVRSDSGDGAIQCRVYAEGVLVAIGTGTGSVDCVARRAP